MKKLVCLAVILAMALVLSVPFLASAASYVQIAITATGSEISVTCNQASWAIGTVSADEVVTTTDNDSWGRITNSTSEAVDLAIHGHDFTGGSGWTLSEDGSTGASTVGMKFALDSGDYTAIPKTTPTQMKDELAASGTQDFGLWFKAPSSGVGNSAMTMADSGLYIEATID